MEMPASENLEMPASENLEIPASENLEMPASENSEMPASENLEMPASQNSEMPASQNLEMPASENSEHTVELNQDIMISDALNDGNVEEKPEYNEEEIKGIMEVIASTGKFWHDWDKLKSMLSFQLKQVLSRYPEAQMTTEQQNFSLGETYQELAKRLDEELLCFDEGPPFTLQRLCELENLLSQKIKDHLEIKMGCSGRLYFGIAEYDVTVKKLLEICSMVLILLAAQSIYPKLSKLALALEKNLLVTSTLAACTDPYPQAVMEIPEEPDKAVEEHHDHEQQSNTVENGAEPAAGDRDEVMTEADNGIDDEMTIDMDALEEIVGGSSEKNSISTGGDS